MALRNRAFIEMVKDVALHAIDGGEPRCLLRASMVQLYFDHPLQHYEAWLRPRAGSIELGLHFESDAEDSRRRLAAVSAEMPAIAAALGPGVEIEEWTERWTRVHETISATTLSEDLAVQVGRRLARYVEVLEPIAHTLGPMVTPVSKVRPRPRRRTPATAAPRRSGIP